jgi:hypothetical protein
MSGAQRLSTWWEDVLPEESPEYVGLVYALVLVWGLGDILSTYFAYAVVGTSQAESNYWISVMLAYDPLLVLVVKAAVVLYAGIILLELQYFIQQVPWWRAWLVVLVLGGILAIINNLVVGLIVLL